MYIVIDHASVTEIAINVAKLFKINLFQLKPAEHIETVQS